MAQFPRLASGVDRSPGQRPSEPQSNEPRAEKPPVSDQDLARDTRVNVLVVGGKDEAANLIMSLWPDLTPIAVRDRGEPLPLSPASPPVGTIVIYDVDTLTRLEQQALNEWLTVGSGRARVVSSAASLFPMVEAGVFDDGLYYRLNVLTIELTSPAGR